MCSLCLLVYQGVGKESTLARNRTRVSPPSARTRTGYPCPPARTKTGYPFHPAPSNSQYRNGVPPTPSARTRTIPPLPPHIPSPPPPNSARTTTRTGYAAGGTSLAVTLLSLFMGEGVSRGPWSFLGEGPSQASNGGGGSPSQTVAGAGYP